MLNLLGQQVTGDFEQCTQGSAECLSRNDMPVQIPYGGLRIDDQLFIKNRLSWLSFIVPLDLCYHPHNTVYKYSYY